MARPPSPLTDEHLARLKQSMAELDIAEGQIRLAQQAGVEVSDSMKTVKDLRDKIQKFRQVYFPGE